MIKAESCNTVSATSPCEVYKRPSIQEQALNNIKHLAANIAQEKALNNINILTANIAQEQKRLDFCKLFPDACKYIEENELYIGC